MTIRQCLCDCVCLCVLFVQTRISIFIGRCELKQGAVMAGVCITPHAAHSSTTFNGFLTEIVISSACPETSQWTTVSLTLTVQISLHKTIQVCFAPDTI